MQTSLSAEFRDTTKGRLADEILRKCVHCGFCNATCPTYELFGDELDGPRGRIYQMKQLFEGGAATQAMRLHLDRCLICRSCETTCPSGVQYGRLLEIGKSMLNEKLPRSVGDRIRRYLIAHLITSHNLFAPLLRLGQYFKGVLPGALADKVPVRQPPLDIKWPRASHPRKMIALAGCVQPVLTPNTNLAAANVLDRFGITLFEVSQAGCCGAVELHTSSETRGKASARALIDLWLPHLEQGAEAIVMTASGCGVTVREYPQLFADDPEYHEKALRVSEKTLDLCEVIERELPSGYSPSGAKQHVGFHSPCTLQHGQQIKGKVESILTRAGHSLCPLQNPHLCCGSAGTYSILQPVISAQLRQDKQAVLRAGRPDVICTANIGCQTQLGVNSDTPVLHWIELLL